jgi:hypothetical protein
MKRGFVKKEIADTDELVPHITYYEIYTYVVKKRNTMREFLRKTLLWRTFL